MINSKMWVVVRDNYATYRDIQFDIPERHRVRLFGQVLAAIVISLFAKNLSDDSIAVLVTALSILIGFAFAAMFPIALESVAGLPKPVYAEDSDDIRVIRQLAVYFRFNVSYFIPLTLLCVSTLLVQMLEFDTPGLLVPLLDKVRHSIDESWHYVIGFRSVVSTLIFAMSMLLLQESCYTFYRMCFNALALLRIKEEYISSRHDV